MCRHLSFLTAAAIMVLTACGDGPTESFPGDPQATGGELVITAGALAPAPAPRAERPSLSDATVGALTVGSSSSPLNLKPTSCEPSGQQITLSYSITGKQDGTATLTVNSVWTFNGSGWSGSVPSSVSVPARAAGAPATVRQITITVINASTTASGASSFTVAPSVTNSNATGAKLGVSAASNATVNVAFQECPVTNRAPTLVVPNDMTIEATSSAGAVVSFTVSASDPEEGDLTAAVSCTPASGTTFTLGETTVNCSVTDGGGLSAEGSFKVNVVDTTPAYFTAFPTGVIELIAGDINGAILNISDLGITVADVGGVSEPSTFSCDYVAGTVLGIGSTTTVSCTAKDARNNESDPSTFDVFVGLNVSGSGFLPPLRMAAPYSVHKRGSTVPHKFLPPSYADGTPAIDLAADLRLVLNRLDGTVEGSDLEVNDYTPGSTAWRYDAAAGQYVFNLKTGTASPWDIGSWKTTVSYKGIVLATTQFDLKK